VKRAPFFLCSSFTFLFRFCWPDPIRSPFLSILKRTPERPGSRPPYDFSSWAFLCLSGTSLKRCRSPLGVRINRRVRCVKRLLAHLLTPLPFPPCRFFCTCGVALAVEEVSGADNVQRPFVPRHFFRQPPFAPLPSDRLSCSPLLYPGHLEWWKRGTNLSLFPSCCLTFFFPPLRVPVNSFSSFF